MSGGGSGVPRAPDLAPRPALESRIALEAEPERKPNFLRLANALWALYPKASEEKRRLEAMPLAAPRLPGGLAHEAPER